MNAEKGEWALAGLRPRVDTEDSCCLVMLNGVKHLAIE